MEIELGGVHQLRARLRNPSPKEVDQGNAKEAVFCAVQGTWKPNERVAKVLEDLMALRVPKGHHIPEGRRDKEWLLDAKGNLRARRPLPLAFLPDAAQSLIRQIQTELADAIRRTVKLLRWRWGLPGSHNPFLARNAVYSLDGVSWHTLPSDTWAEILPSAYFQLTEHRRDLLAELAAGGAEEPLGRELLREAETLRRQAPRSALLIGVSALEVGFKELVAKLIPAAEWLVENVVSPPVAKMLEEYLPTLPVRLNFDGRTLPPPKPVVDQLKKAVQVRNRVTHARGRALTGEGLDEVLRAIEDILWLLDYYAGNEWALLHLRKETRIALTGKAEPDEEDS